jgi:hypothetical protein
MIQLWCIGNLDQTIGKAKCHAKTLAENSDESDQSVPIDEIVEFNSNLPDRPLKSCHIDHLLWNHVSSLTFMRGTLTDHFSLENDQCSLHDRDDRLRSVMGKGEAYQRAYRGSYRTYQADMCARLCMVMHMCRQTKSISVHAHVHTCTKWICR